MSFLTTIIIVSFGGKTLLHTVWYPKASDERNYQIALDTSISQVETQSFYFWKPFINKAGNYGKHQS